MALTPGEAAMVIHNYEVPTGHVVSMAELESGYFKGRLCPVDYDIKQRVGLYPHKNLKRDRSREPLLRGLTHIATPGGFSCPFLLCVYFAFQSKELMARHHRGLQAALAVPTQDLLELREEAEASLTG